MRRSGMLMLMRAVLMCALLMTGSVIGGKALSTTESDLSDSPEMSVDPDSIYITLITGDATSTKVRIINSGSDTLNWQAEVRPVYFPGVPLDLTGIRCLFTTYDNYCSAPSSLVSDLTARGATVDILDHQTNPYTLLNDSYDMLWLYALGEVPSEADLFLLLDWLRSGKRGVYIVGVTYWTSDTVDLLSDSLNAGMETQTIETLAGVTNEIASHPITINVESLELPAYCLEFLDISPPAELLASTAESISMAALSRPENDRIVVIGSNLFMSYYLTLADNRLLGNQAFDWLALESVVIPWADVVPECGTTSMSDTTELVVSLDATDLVPGQYSALLRITSDDPFNGTIDVPIELNVVREHDVKELVRAALDIKPGSCPNLFNIKVLDSGTLKNPRLLNYSVLSVALLGDSEFDVTQVDVATIELEGVAALGHNFEDIAGPSPSQELCACPESGADGYMDMVLEFKESDITGVLISAEHGEEVLLTLVGRLMAGNPVVASDCVKIIKKIKIYDPGLRPNKEVILAAAEPNPFNPVTQISYYLPADMLVDLSVYDVTGRLVERLVNEVQSEGEHSIQWNAAGKASGVYFCRLAAGDVVRVKRVILLR